MPHASTASSKRFLGWLVRGYERTLKAAALNARALMLFLLIATAVLTVRLYISLAQGLFPARRYGSDHRVHGGHRRRLVRSDARPANSGRRHGAVGQSGAGVGSSVGAGGFNSSMNQGRMFISLKPLAERGGRTTQQVINRLRKELAAIQGLSVFMNPAADIRMGARSGKSTTSSRCGIPTSTSSTPGRRRSSRS